MPDINKNIETKQSQNEMIHEALGPARDDGEMKMGQAMQHFPEVYGRARWTAYTPPSPCMRHQNEKEEGHDPREPTRKNSAHTQTHGPTEVGAPPIQCLKQMHLALYSSLGLYLLQ